MKASVFVGASLDGFIARETHALDFLHSGGEGPPADLGYNEFFATVDALVMGRNTFDVVLAFDKWPYGAKPIFVLTTRALPKPPKGAVVERMSGEPAQIVSTLAKRGFKHLYIDGGITIQRFLNAGLIDRITVTRVPVVIGSGIPLFGAVSADVKLHHVATRALQGGAVQSEYDVVR